MKRVVKALCFILVGLLLLEAVQAVIQDKGWNRYPRIKMFYRMKPKPDVVFIGSSQIYYGVSPLTLFHEEGIASYDFSNSEAEYICNELYVKEVLKQCTPKVIVMDMSNFTGLPLSEENTRWWLDLLPLSLDKLETVQRLYDVNSKFEQGYEYDSMISYVFPLLRYHDRWNALSKDDFILDPEKCCIVKYYHGAARYQGASHQFGVVQADFSQYEDEVEIDPLLLEDAKKSFERVVQQCQESGTELLIIKSPTPGWRKCYNDIVREWTDEYGVPYLDQDEIMESAGISADTDYNDPVHLNYTGAEKLSRYLGAYLKENYDIPDHRDDPQYASWNDDWMVFQRDVLSYQLAHESDWTSYLEKLKDPDYTIYIAGKDDLGGERHPELTSQLKSLGLTDALDTARLRGYIAIIDGGEVIYEDLQDAPLTYQAEVNGHHVEMVSESYYQGNRSSIRFDWTERAVNHRGINFVVYDNILKDVVDSVSFDLWEGGTVYR